MAALSTHLPLHAHLSSINPQALDVVVPTSQARLDEPDVSHHHPDHALAASSDPQTGLLLRLLSDSTVLEISSLSLTSTRAPTAPRPVVLPRPLRFLFPSPLVPTPAVIATPGGPGGVQIVAVSITGFVYRLSLPSLGSKWEEHVERAGWSSEYELRSAGLVTSKGMTVCHVVDDQVVLVGLGDGGVLRFEQDQGRSSSCSFHPTRG